MITRTGHDLTTTIPNSFPKYKFSIGKHYPNKWKTRSPHIYETVQVNRIAIKSRRLILPQHGEPVNYQNFWRIKIKCLSCVKYHLASYIQLANIWSICS